MKTVKTMRVGDVKNSLQRKNLTCGKLLNVKNNMNHKKSITRQITNQELQESTFNKKSFSSVAIPTINKTTVI